MSAERFDFITVSQLAGLRFFVEDYQRGYKWTCEKVEDLLRDIADFGAGNPPGATENFYCLQPVVVKPQEREGVRSYELIDGQQRVTTIYLILTYLRKSANFDIDYRTRRESVRFLPDIAQISRQIVDPASVDHIDHYYFLTAYRTIEQWFGKHGGEAGFADTLLLRTKLLWYEVVSEAEGADAKDIFIRLNSGKIVLTSAELIKALFLRANAYSEHDNPEAFRLRQREIAREWDEIEYALRDDAFWYFINRAPGENDPPTRIEFVFDLICGKSASDPYHSFRHYEKALKDGPDAAENEWEKVAAYFHRLREWYQNHRLYHLVGFVVARGLESVKSLLDRSAGCTKTDFDTHVLAVIRKEVGAYSLSSLRYDDPNDHDKLKNVLLLFSIQTVLESGTSSRFPFDRYKAVKWSLEHIHAQESKALTTVQELKLWQRTYEDHVRDLEDRAQAKPLAERLARWRDEGRDEATRLVLEKEINQAVNDQARKQNQGEEEPHALTNLALLDVDANAALNNAIFPIKRKRLFALIAERRQQGREVFVPETTKNVFLKYYSSADISQMDRWDGEDRTRYLKAITDSLEKLGIKNKD